ncbi:23S rRNA (pseudouridine(1915)-N(3))-methyltransferase RlmH [Salsuginibacillus kocurii]|uniref:23S rRNA (pseudouridine(1915)-N(3))-methyltransferase RlmH n=1 Tax=Salsuginibacillus kocurii TaxID=427078 RepID=UPI000369AC46|nr:23S rRNA (pseudouridine(1915)-N(3))-methyltransferase RlmH [Salsuginibacillus kocurii]
MQIQIVAAGKLKERYLQEGISEYEKRLKKDAALQIIEVPDEKTPSIRSEKEETLIKEKEGKKLLAKIPHDAYVIALEPQGKEFTSEELADHLKELAIYGKSKVSFIIGGSLGLSKEVLQRADRKWSFSKLTFPHQLIRLMLVEQLYRSFQIQKGTPYHK